MKQPSEKHYYIYHDKKEKRSYLACDKCRDRKLVPDYLTEYIGARANTANPCDFCGQQFSEIKGARFAND